MARIYTKTGDTGETGLIGGQRISKHDKRVCAYGDVDELNSLIGWIRTLPLLEEVDQRLQSVQRRLFDLGTLLANPVVDIQDETTAETLSILSEEASCLEKWIDQGTAELPELKNFILPSGGEIGSRMHIARAVCRRAERSVVALENPTSLSAAIVFLNRLSDALFVAARFCNAQEHKPETVWTRA